MYVRIRFIYKEYTPAVRSKILSKLIFSSCVRYCVSCDLCVVYHVGLFVFYPTIFLISRVTGACSVTADLIMRVNVRKTTTKYGGQWEPVRRLAQNCTYMIRSKLDIYKGRTWCVFTPSKTED